MTNSERELEFTFAKNYGKFSHCQIRYTDYRIKFSNNSEHRAVSLRQWAFLFKCWQLATLLVRCCECQVHTRSLCCTILFLTSTTLPHSLHTCRVADIITHCCMVVLSTAWLFFSHWYLCSHCYEIWGLARRRWGRQIWEGRRWDGTWRTEAVLITASGRYR